MSKPREAKVHNYTFSQYQEQTAKTAVYPESGTGSLTAISYCALGLAGEAGEIANKVKKLLRDGDRPEKRAIIFQEIGDQQWYAAQLARELGGLLGEAAYDNILKLADRATRGVIKGNGDNR